MLERRREKRGGERSLVRSMGQRSLGEWREAEEASTGRLLWDSSHGKSATGTRARRLWVDFRSLYLADSCSSTLILEKLRNDRVIDWNQR